MEQHLLDLYLETATKHWKARVMLLLSLLFFVFSPFQIFLLHSNIFSMMLFTLEKVVRYFLLPTKFLSGILVHVIQKLLDVLPNRVSTNLKLPTTNYFSNTVPWQLPRPFAHTPCSPSAKLCSWWKPFSSYKLQLFINIISAVNTKSSSYHCYTFLCLFDQIILFNFPTFGYIIILWIWLQIFRCWHKHCGERCIDAACKKGADSNSLSKSAWTFPTWS